MMSDPVAAEGSADAQDNVGCDHADNETTA
jgi:hypothetical protein